MLSGAESKRRQITVNVSEQLVALIDRLKGEYGVRSRGRVLEMVLEDLLESPQSELERVSPSSEDQGESTEVSSLVLIGSGSSIDAGVAENRPWAAPGDYLGNAEDEVGSGWSIVENRSH